MNRIYLDYAATTPLNKDVLATFQKVQELYDANPDGLYDSARNASKLIDEASDQIAKLLGIKRQEVVYTSGATEANNLAIIGIAQQYAARGKHIITTKIEHASVAEPMKYLEKHGFDIEYVPVDRNGLVDMRELEKMVRKDTILVSVIAVNNEIGTIQSIDTLAKLVKRVNPLAVFHTDMAQAVGKMDIDLSSVDLATFSAHKFYGPKGSGILIKKEHISLTPLFHGGQQQRGMRPGTLSPALIAATSKALRIALESKNKNTAYVQELYDELRAFFHANESVRCTIEEGIATPYILHLMVTDPVTQIETYINAFNQAGLEVATRSTCHSKSVHLPNDVLVALGIDEQASRMGIRLSLSHLVMKEDIKRVQQIFTDVENLLHFK